MYLRKAKICFSVAQLLSLIMTYKGGDLYKDIVYVNTLPSAPELFYYAFALRSPLARVQSVCAPSEWLSSWKSS